MTFGIFSPAKAPSSSSCYRGDIGGLLVIRYILIYNYIYIYYYRFPASTKRWRSTSSARSEGHTGHRGVGVNREARDCLQETVRATRADPRTVSNAREEGEEKGLPERSLVGTRRREKALRPATVPVEKPKQLLKRS